MPDFLLRSLRGLVASRLIQNKMILNGAKGINAQTAKPSRNASVEVARFISAIGIVWFHSPVPFSEIGLAGLSVFFVYLVYFSSTRSLKLSRLSDVALANLHLLAIWLIWCAIYLVLKIAQAIIQNHPINGEFEQWMWLTGPALHLWFLPFSYLMILVAYIVLRLMNRIYLLLGAVLILGLLALAVFVSVELHGYYIIPFAQYLSVLPPVVFAILLVRYPAGTTEYWIAALAGISILAILPSDIYVPWLLGCVVAAATLAWRVVSSPITLTLGRISLTIYLIHPAVSSVIMDAGLFGFGVQENTILIIVVCVIVSILIDRLEYKKILGLR